MASVDEINLFQTNDDRIQIIFDYDDLEITSATLVASAVTATLDTEHFNGPDHVTVMITGDDQIKELNKFFNGYDEVTDVLSFGQIMSEEEKNEKVNSEVAWGSSSYEFFENQNQDTLGDIAISLPQVRRQAAEKGKNEYHELAMITIHGVLHLLGYDHVTQQQGQMMFGKTDSILSGMELS